MKRLLSIMLVLLMVISCSKIEPNNEDAMIQYSITTEDSDIVINDKVNVGEDYHFVLPYGSTYNKVFANGVEIISTSQNEYIIEHVTQDYLITFNNQYDIILPYGLGYDIEITSEHSILVNEGDTVEFHLVIHSDHSNSTPIVKVNKEVIEVVDEYFVVENINEDIILTVENVIENEVVVIPDDIVDPIEPTQPDYTIYSNQDLSWWYRIPTTLNTHTKPTIDPSIKTLLNTSNGLWMIDTTEKKVVLTMDEGYEYENNTQEILDIARDKGVVITFFITGGYIDKNPQLVKRMVAEGHVVANHTNKHMRASAALNPSNDTFVNDIIELEEKFRVLTGQEISSFYRPPEGGYSERSLVIAKDLGYTTVFWSFAYRDWLVDDQPTIEEAYNKVISQLHPGAIILLHAVSNTNVSMLGDLIDEIRAQGYTFTTLPT